MSSRQWIPAFGAKNTVSADQECRAQAGCAYPNRLSDMFLQTHAKEITTRQHVYVLSEWKRSKCRPMSSALGVEACKTSFPRACVRWIRAFCLDVHIIVVVRTRWYVRWAAGVLAPRRSPPRIRPILLGSHRKVSDHARVLVKQSPTTNSNTSCLFVFCGWHFSVVWWSLPGLLVPGPLVRRNRRRDEVASASSVPQKWEDWSTEEICRIVQTYCGNRPRLARALIE